MASIHQRPGSRYWHAAWRDGDGRLHLQSTKQTDKGKAQTFALEIERSQRMADKGNLTEAQAREILNGILERTESGESLRMPATEVFLRDWLTAKEATKAEGTADRYGVAIDQFLQHLASKAKRPLNAVVAQDVEGFYTKRLKAGVAPGTAALDVKILRAAFNSARRKNIISANPAEAVEMESAQHVKRGTFTAAEVKMLVDTAEGEWKTLILLAYYTGQRLSDCCAIEWEAVDFSAGAVSFRQKKTNEKVVIPLHDELTSHLEGLAGDTAEKHVMPHLATLGPGGRHGLSEGFKRIMRKAGLDVESVQGHGVRRISRRSFHALRHSFTSALANAGVAKEVRMKLTGHKSEAIHDGYTHHELKVLKAAVDKLPALSSLAD